jgi:hypothetical protein
LEKFECFGCGFEQHVCGDPIVCLEEIMEFFRNRKNDVEMRAIRQTLTDLLCPLRLSRSKAVRAVAVAAGAGIPFRVLATLAASVVISKLPLAAESHEVEGRILLLAQTTRPEVAPLA